MYGVSTHVEMHVHHPDFCFLGLSVLTRGWSRSSSIGVLDGNCPGVLEVDAQVPGGMCLVFPIVKTDLELLGKGLRDKAQAP